MAVVIRAATPADLPAIVAIYNHEVLHGVATFDTEPWSVEEQTGWLAAHQSASHPCLVAEEAGTVVGWGTLSPWSSRCAYARAVEDSVYVHHAHRGRGIGRACCRRWLRAPATPASASCWRGSRRAEP